MYAMSRPGGENFPNEETLGNSRYDALTISTAGLKGPDPPKAIQSIHLSSTSDPGLTAFAHLGCYKLEAARVMISLFDRRYQHIIAEALRPPPSAPWSAAHHQPVSFNGLSFERATSVCEHVVTQPAGTQSIPGTAFGLDPTDIPVSIIKSLDDDARFCHIADSARQFYAGVPIRSPTGINIGVYCMFDDKPRPEGLHADDVRFMQDISRVVMDYLESKRSHEWYRREQRMVNGLGRFVNGQATLRKSVSESSDSPTSCQDSPGMNEGLPNKKLQSSTAAAAQHQPQKRQQQEVMHNLDVSTKDHLSPSWSDPATTKASLAATIASPSSFSPVSLPTSEPLSSSTTAKTQSSTTNLLGSKIDHVFSKAANIIREAIEVEGVLFLDASVRSYCGLIGNDPTARQPSPGLDCDRGNASNEDVHTPAPAQPACDVLGFSTSQNSSLVEDATPNEFEGCRERFLQRLLQKHPRGQVWNFDADGTVSDHNVSSDDNESPTEWKSKQSTTAARIIKIFPGARSVALVPLWDAQAGRWFAGGFAWTRTPTRTLSEEDELTYFRVFGLTVMAEVTRLKTRAADKAKTDMLGSISHELRSPLHGLVGAVELLRHTSLDALQDSILRTIEASGRTLLDTIDHLLDFAKINAKQWSRTGRKSLSSGSRQRSISNSNQQSPPEPPIQLDVLVEDVVESVFAGSSYLTRSETDSTSFTANGGTPATTESHTSTGDQQRTELSVSNGSVQIYLDIEQPAKWSFHMHPGAFRRIVMNLFGNALKFTRSGFIRVSLRQETHPMRSDVPTTNWVVLAVSDSGKGMTEDYLRNHIFTPFSQEDQFAVGTGLGLSLVRHMTVTLGGTINVSSKTGQGTTITVALPLLPAAELGRDGEEADFQHNIKTLTGQRVQLRNFQHESGTHENLRTDHGRQSPQSELTRAVCRDMLQMEVIQELDGPQTLPDFVICALAQEMEKATLPIQVLPKPANSKASGPLLQQPLLKQPENVVVAEVNAPGSSGPTLDSRKPILIVDDNAINLKIMAAYLTKLKYTFTTAINGLEALQIYTGNPGKYSCLLTDISMPVMDGLESTRRVREFELSGGHKPMVVIALTGLSDPEVRQDALASGVDLFLTRPLALRGLKEALATTGLG
ncbi:hypothetical protein TruAng_002133 [Truncatella angustata]|nr:hypothetical protein TruAng_002133 [Truncatella angustata]